jgi:hypothetical protein
MFYRALGWLVWHGGKYFLRRRYSWFLPKPIFAGAAALAAGSVVAVLVARHHSTDS